MLKGAFLRILNDVFWNLKMMSKFRKKRKYGAF